MKNILDNYGMYILIILGVIVIAIAVILIITSKKKKNIDEDNSSILDVNVEGVVDKDFEYGYVKEDTVVVKPEDLQNEEPAVGEQVSEETASVEEPTEETNNEEEKE